AGTAGGIRAASTVTEENSIVATNGSANCSGTVTDNGHNISFPGATCPGSTGDPKLGALQDNRGPTQTMAIASDSSAKDPMYTPASGYTVPESFNNHATSNTGTASDKTVSITVDPPPVCNELNVATAAGQPTAVQLECTDSAATLTYAIDSSPAHGAISGLDS